MACITSHLAYVAQNLHKSLQTKRFVIINPQLYKWISFEFFQRSNSVNPCPCHFQTSAVQTCIQIVHKPAKVVEILVDGWKCKAISVKSFLQYIAKKALTAKCCQINFNDISFHAQTVP